MVESWQCEFELRDEIMALSFNYLASCWRCYPLMRMCTKCQVDDKWPAVTDKFVFVRCPNAGERYHFSLLEAICSQERWGFFCFFFNASPSLCVYVCLALRHWSDWLSCGCLSVCRISLQTRVFYSACLPDSCRSPRTQNSSLQITVFPSCRAVFVSCATWCYR